MKKVFCVVDNFFVQHHLFLQCLFCFYVVNFIAVYFYNHTLIFQQGHLIQIFVNLRLYEIPLIYVVTSKYIHVYSDLCNVPTHFR